MKARLVTVAAALILSGCNFSPSELVGGDPSYDNYEQTGPVASGTYNPPTACSSNGYYERDHVVGGCDVPKLAQIEIKPTAKAGEVELILHPDDVGNFPEFMDLGYYASQNWAEPGSGSGTKSFPMACDAPVIQGDLKTSTCRPPDSWIASSENGNDPATWAAGLGSIEIKSANCLSFVRVALEYDHCPGEGPAEVHFQAPTFWVKVPTGS